MRTDGCVLGLTHGCSVQLWPPLQLTLFDLSPLQDSTRYFVSLPVNKLELWFALESERFLVRLSLRALLRQRSSRVPLLMSGRPYWEVQRFVRA